MDAFDPLTRAWFAERFGAPTDVQARAWPRIAAGEHLLATAPTGSGKTLAAFLWALDRLVTGAWEGGAVRVLYVSPLKALNNDIGRNLLTPLRELTTALGDRARPVHVHVRSGDTPTSERRRFATSPPEILVTTPESLHLILTSPRARENLRTVRTVILDEIHAVAGTKRGSYLMAGLEHLVSLSGEVQRIALSATVEPLAEVAAFVGGRGRRVATERATTTKEVQCRIDWTARAPAADSIWPSIVDHCKERLEHNRSTLFFVNNRASSEQLAAWINEGAPEPIAYSHHGSLSREIRALVEERLRKGTLKALVATSSLELGIDVGYLDEVVLVQTPRTLNAAVQRIGRAGHGVGEVSRGRIVPLYPTDLLEATVLAPLVVAQRVEPVRPVRAPLDVLAQCVLSLCAVEERTPDDVFAIVTRAAPYQELQRVVFDRVIAMLRGRYADTRLRELQPRLRLDPETGRLRAAGGVLQTLYRSGGVIPDRGYFTLRVEGSNTRLGELDEEFVWERRPGHQFVIGTQVWRVHRIDRNDVFVVPGGEGRAAAPFWKAEVQPRDWPLCAAIADFLQTAETTPRAELEPLLRTQFALEQEAAQSVLSLLDDQKRRSRAPLPHRWHVLIERVEGAGREGELTQIYVHARWGGRMLNPLSLAWSALLEDMTGSAVEAFSNDDGVVLSLPGAIDESSLFSLLDGVSIATLLQRDLGASGFFGTRFRECAGRALLLPRGMPGKRVPLWLTRIRAQKLMTAVAPYQDFPILAETWRTCLEDEFDLVGLRERLDEVADGRITVTCVTSPSPSPLAGNLAWRMTDRYMYDQIERPVAGAARMSADVMQDVLRDTALRPQLDPELCASFAVKLQRTAPGYEPRDAAEFVDHADERLLIAAPPDTPGLLAHLDGFTTRGVKARLERAATDDHALVDVVRQAMEGFGPVTPAFLADRFNLARARVALALEELVREECVIAGPLRRGAEDTEYCDAENLERLLRMQRNSRRATVRPKPLATLAPFLAQVQGVGRAADDLRAPLETLFGYPLSVELWEQTVLPARVANYQPQDLDALFAQGDLVWFGAGKQKVAFAFHDEIDLFAEPLRPEDRESPVPSPGRFDFFEIQQRTGLQGDALTQKLWEGAWRGAVHNDTFAALRQGAAARYRAAGAAGKRSGWRAWRSSRPLSGNWRVLPRGDDALDRLDALEQDKRRVRQLLARYGVLFRALLGHELSPSRWGRLLTALRLMELSGEVLAGQFFDDIDGLQFLDPRWISWWSAAPSSRVVAFAASDPASLCGLGLPLDLPPRLATTHLVYEGSSLVLVARRKGREIDAHKEVTVEHIRAWLRSSVRETRYVQVLNGEPAVGHALENLFRDAGFQRDRAELVYERRFDSDDDAGTVPTL